MTDEHRDLRVQLDVSSGVLADAEGRVLAKTITVDGDDIETSQMIEAGLQPIADQVLENEKALLDHEKAIGANKENIAANDADIETNQQQIAAHKRRLKRI